jgi:hypothetical protein
MPGEGQPETRQDKSRILIVAAIIIGALLLIFVWMTSGTSGVFAMLKKWMIYAIIAVVLGLIVWVVLRLMRKEKIDLVENDRKDIIDAGILSKPPMVNDLYFTGDKEHSEFRVGKIIGYCQITSYKDVDLIAGLSNLQIEELQKQGKMPADLLVREDCFIFKRFGFPMSLFEQPKVFRCLENEHSQLIGDVKIYGVSLIKKFSYYWPNRAHLDLIRMDVAVIREAWRGGIHQFLKDMVSINQRAVGLDSEFKKELDQRKLLKLPSPMGEEAQRR